MMFHFPFFHPVSVPNPLICCLFFFPVPSEGALANHLDAPFQRYDKINISKGLRIVSFI